MKYKNWKKIMKKIEQQKMKNSRKIVRIKKKSSSKKTKEPVNIEKVLCLFNSITISK